MPISFLSGDSRPGNRTPATTDFRPRGARRLIIVTDDHGNQALRLVPEDRAIFVAVMPHCGEESERRVIKDAFAGIGDGLTSVSGRDGDGEWRPEHRSPVLEPVELLSGLGPHTEEARGDFVKCLSLLGELLGQELVVGLMLPLGEVFEVWNHCLIQVRPGDLGVAEHGRVAHP